MPRNALFSRYCCHCAYWQFAELTEALARDQQGQGDRALILPVANVTANSLQRMAEVMRAYSWQWPDQEAEAAETEAEA